MGRWLLVCALTACASPVDSSIAQPITNGALDADDAAVLGLVDSTGLLGCTATAIEAHRDHCGALDRRT